MANPQYNINAYSHVVDLSTYDTEGFLASFEGESFELRRTNDDVEAYCTAGTDDLRIDWETYIGPVQEFGSRNDIDGHWCGLCLPLILPERHYMVAYIFEYAFYHDTILESIAAAAQGDSSTLFMDNTSSRSRRAIQGAKQLQSKIFVGFLEGDKERVARIVRTWVKMTSTTAKREKTEIFKDILEYEEYRMVDTGAFYVEAVMLWGMGLTLSDEEDALLEEIRRPAYAALGLTNDYYSFDVEYDGYLKSDGVGSLTNAVWLYMQWEKCDIATAKELTRVEVNRLEREFLRLKREFEQGSLGSNEKLVYYVRALSFQIPGNLIWSLKAPRYNPQYRENLGLLGLMSRPEGHGVDVYPKAVAPKAAPESLTLSMSESGSEDGKDAALDSPILRPTSPASSATTVDDLAESMLLEKPSQEQASLTNREETSASIESSTAQETADQKELAAQPTTVVVAPPSVPKSQLIEALLQSASQTPAEMQAKKLREAFIDALSIWLDVPAEITTSVKVITSTLSIATSSIDSKVANAALLHGLGLARQLPSYASSEICLDELTTATAATLESQGWQSSLTTPSEAEYLSVTETISGATLRIASRLMLAHDESSPTVRTDVFETLIASLTRAFALLGDLSLFEAAKMGDLTAATKLSLPLIHALTSEVDGTLRSAISATQSGEVSVEQKLILLKGMATSVGYTMKLVGQLQSEFLKTEIPRLEAELGLKNWPLRLILQRTLL